MKKKYKRWLNLGSKLYGIFSWIVFVLTFAIFTFIALGKMFEIFSHFNEIEFVKFCWQIIMFSFVLAALIFNIRNEFLDGGQQRYRSFLALLFVWSGFFTIIGFGCFATGQKAEEEIYMKAGQIIFLIAQLSLSFGIAIMLAETFRNLVATLDQKK